MVFPKVLLCHLGTAPIPPTEEAALRAVGFAVASVRWAELNAQPRGWMQLAEVLREPGLAWIMAGAAEEFTDEIRSCMSMLTLSLPTPLPLICLPTDGGVLSPLPEPLGHARIERGAVWAAKVMALRHKAVCPVPLPLHLRAHASLLTGLWLELGPPTGDIWRGFMVGVIGGQFDALGVGPRGQVPQRCALHYPQMGIQGDMDGQPFYACAAQNIVDAQTACYVRVAGCASSIFVTEAPDMTSSDATESGTQPLACVCFE